MMDLLFWQLIFIVHIKLDAERYAEAVRMTAQKGWDASMADEKLKKYFGNISICHLKDPAIVVDMFGRILIWFLPDILSHRLVKYTTFSFSFILMFLLINKGGCCCCNQNCQWTSWKISQIARFENSNHMA